MALRSIVLLWVSALLAAVLTVEAKTTVTVLSGGERTVVRRAEGGTEETTIAAVSSLWGALHSVKPNMVGRRRKLSISKLQYPGMPVVPDLFETPDGGLVVTIFSATKISSSLPEVASMLEQDESVVGHVSVSGTNKASQKQESPARALLDRVTEDVNIDTSLKSFESALKLKAKRALENGNLLEAVALDLTDDVSGEADAKVASLLKSLLKENSSLVIHFVVEEPEDIQEVSSHGRRLEAQDADAAEEQFDDAKANSGTFSSSTNAKSMNQIQYFQVTLWTSITLGLVLIYCLYSFATMQMIPDTLLFGESGKMMSSAD